MGDAGRRFTPYLDDASRLIIWWGVFNEAARKHAVKVLDGAISAYGKPMSILSDAAPSSTPPNPKKGRGDFKVREAPERLGHTARTGRGGPFPDQRRAGAARGEMQRKLRLFRDVAGQPGICSSNSPHIEMGPVAWFERWHNNERSHMPLDMDVEETPAMVFERKTLPPGSDVTDE